MMDYQPATAIVTTYQKSSGGTYGGSAGNGRSVLVEPEDVPGLLGMVANLIARRVGKKVARELRHSGN
jgi:hypothetical protein